MDLRKLYLTKNKCYTKGGTHKVVGLMLHSTGSNNPWLKRYVGPDDGALGVNKYGNHWNTATPGGRKVCVHGFIGKLESGAIATYQTLPWTMPGWHSGIGSKGESKNANNTGWIGVEICEDGLSDKTYFQAVYREAVELFAYLCKEFDLDPMTDILCHSEGHSKGIASNHGDVMHWFPKHGKSMDTFRTDVQAQIENNQEEIDVIVYRTLRDVPKTHRPTIQKLMEAGALTGYENPDPNSLDDNILNVDETYCRVMTTLDRLGKLRTD